MLEKDRGKIGAPEQLYNCTLHTLGNERQTIREGYKVKALVRSTNGCQNGLLRIGHTNDPDEYCTGLATVSKVAQSLTVVGRSPRP